MPKRKLTAVFVKTVHPDPARRVLYWDTVQEGLVLAVEPSGGRAFKLYFRRSGRARWHTLGKARRLELAVARQISRDLNARLCLDETFDPQVERQGRRQVGLLQDLCDRYVQEYARHRHKSWGQAEYILTKYLVPKLGRRPVTDIRRADMRALFAHLTHHSGPVLANRVIAHASAVFAWAIKQEVVKLDLNPCRGIERNAMRSRERIVSDAEWPGLWRALLDLDEPVGAALRVLALCGQRPGEVAHMRWQDIEGSWWTLPGKPTGNWPGTKNGNTHRVWLVEHALELIEAARDDQSEFIFAGPRGARLNLGWAMRLASRKIGLDDANNITPHDLRRSHGTAINRLGFGRPAMNRLQNHTEGGISSVYDRHGYGAEIQTVQEAVARHILTLAGVLPASPDNVIALHPANGA
jgi:integrase